MREELSYLLSKESFLKIVQKKFAVYNLTTDELKKVEKCVINSTSIDRVRDLFLFQCYTGLAYADFAKFDFKKDVEERNGKYIVADRRKKTNEDYFIVFLTPAVELLQKYDFVLPVISQGNRIKFSIFF